MELEGIGRDEVGGEWWPMLSSSSLCLALLPISTLTLKILVLLDLPKRVDECCVVALSGAKQNQPPETPPACRL